MVDGSEADGQLLAVIKIGLDVINGAYSSLRLLHRDAAARMASALVCVGAQAHAPRNRSLKRWTSSLGDLARTPAPIPVGWRVWAFGIVMLGLVGLALGGFDPGQPVPKWLPGRALLAVLANGFMVMAGVAVQWRRATAPAAAALAAYYLAFVVVLLDGRIIVTHPNVFGSYDGAAEQLALGTVGVLIWAQSRTNIPPRRSVAQASRIAFGLCAILFGAAHFVYFNLTVPLVPKWLPLPAGFWAYATGIAQVVAGLSIATGIQARLAATLLTVMYALFTPLVHLPLLLGDPHNGYAWSENALNIALTGAAWVVAESLRRPTWAPRVGLDHLERLKSGAHLSGSSTAARSRG